MSTYYEGTNPSSRDNPQRTLTKILEVLLNAFSGGAAVPDRVSFTNNGATPPVPAWKKFLIASDGIPCVLFQVDISNKSGADAWAMIFDSDGTPLPGATNYVCAPQPIYKGNSGFTWPFNGGIKFTYGACVMVSTSQTVLAYPAGDDFFISATYKLTT